MLLKKKNDIPVYSALLGYRNIPLIHLGFSPSQLLLNRICRTKLPIMTEIRKYKYYAKISVRN